MKNMFIIFFYWYWTIHQWIVQRLCTSSVLFTEMWYTFAEFESSLFIGGTKTLDIQYSWDFSHTELKSHKPKTTTTSMESRFCVCPWYCTILCCMVLNHILTGYSGYTVSVYLFLIIFVPKGKNNWIIFIPWNKSYGIFIPPVWHLFHLWEVHLL